MKSIRTFLPTCAALFVSLHLLHAQTASFGGSVIGIAQPIQSPSSDSIVAVTADAYGLAQVAPTDLPRYGTYWVVLSYAGMVPLPCPPQDQTLPIYAVTDNIFLVDATGGQVAVSPRSTALMGSAQALSVAVTARGNAIANLIEQVQDAQMMRDMAMMFGMDVPGFGDGGGDGGGYTNSFVGFTIDTNQLWLEITNVANGISYLNAHHATNQVYAIWTTTDLLQPFTVETELWPTNGDCQPFTLANYDRQFLFVRAQDWTGVTHGGNTAPDWWLWKYFGTTALSDTNLDSQGNTLGYDYANHLDPNVIFFTLTAKNYLNTDSAAVTANVSGGSPSYLAVSVNGSATNWQNFVSPNLSVYLGSTNGTYTVAVGLKGLAPAATETWQTIQITRDTTPLVLTLTNLTSLSGSKPFIDPAGYANKALRSLTYTLIDANGNTNTGTGQALACGLSLSDPAHVTNQINFVDLALALGTNWISLQATDWSGNVAVTNFNYIFDTNGDVTPTTLSFSWPQNNTVVCGNSFTVQATMGDDTATATLQYTDTNGVTQTVNGLVERGGNLWFENVPLVAGTNSFTIQAITAAGNMTSTNLTVVQSLRQFSIAPLDNTSLNQSVATVTGYIDNPADGVTVNGVTATVDGSGNWTAANVPLPPGGTVTLTAVADSGEQVMLEQDRPAVVFTERYGYNLTYTSDVEWGNVSLDWTNGAGGTQVLSDSGIATRSDQTFVYDYEVRTVWPADTGYVPVLGGQMTTSYYEDGNLINSFTNSVGPPDVAWMEQTAASGVSAFYSGLNYDEASSREVRLATGGKAVRQSQALFDLSAGYTQLDNVDWGLMFWWEGSNEAGDFLQPDDPPKAVSATSIALGSLGNLMSDGHFWTMQANSGVQTITPQAAGYFTGSLPGQVKYALTITAATNNGTPINLATNTPEFCVGQKVTFTLANLPMGNIANMAGNWQLPAKFVNQQTNYSATCTNYILNSDWLQNTNRISGWFYNTNSGHVSVGLNLLMNNGQSVSVAANGDFTVYKPTVKPAIDNNGIWYFDPRNYSLVEVGTIGGYSTLGLYTLSLGNFSMHHFVSVKSKYSGAANYVQLISASDYGDFYPYHQDTSGSFVLDNTYPYNDSDKTIQADIKNTVDLTDTPSMPGLYTIAVDDNFKDYLIFKPDGDPQNIYVSLARVDWYWRAAATLSIISPYWSVTNDCPPPQFYDEDAFPYFTDTILNGFPYPLP